jgi:hypothetical protein
MTAIQKLMYLGAMPSSRHQHRRVSTFYKTNLGMAILEQH